MFSCSGDLATRHFKSPEKFTGGFNNFELNLDKNGHLELFIETSIEKSQNNAGTVWELRQKKVNGSWTLKNNTIKCEFDEAKTSIDSVFMNSAFTLLTKEELIRFNKKRDTVFIYGIPCVETVINENQN